MVLEKSDVFGYRLGCLRPIQTEIRREKAYHKTKASELSVFRANCGALRNSTFPNKRDHLALAEPENRTMP